MYRLTDAVADTSSISLRGLDLFHDFSFMADGWAGWETVASRIQAAGGTFVSVRATLTNGAVSAHCRVQNLSSAAAERLAERLPAEGECRGMRLDHVYLAKKLR